MSASLVGSEMCIRDRSLRLLDLQCTPVSAGVLVSISASAISGAGSQSSGCLLYTSPSPRD
eukprot:8346910-Alexandrium_andersonii.AAC.1